MLNNNILKQKLQILRTGKPTVPQLRFIRKGHNAPGSQPFSGSIGRPVTVEQHCSGLWAVINNAGMIQKIWSRAEH